MGNKNIRNTLLLLAIGIFAYWASIGSHLDSKDTYCKVPERDPLKEVSYYEYETSKWVYKGEEPVIKNQVKIDIDQFQIQNSRHRMKGYGKLQINGQKLFLMSEEDLEKYTNEKVRDETGESLDYWK
jgi:hypothetical protein